MKHTLLLLSLLGVLGFVACDDDDDNTVDTSGGDQMGMVEETPTVPEMAEVKLNVTGLKELGSEFVYEGWLITEAGPVSSGRFTDPALESQEVTKTLLDSATAYVLTIEPKDETGDALATPADSKLFIANFEGNNTATVTTGTIGDFSDISGKFFLRTPTDDSVNDMNDEAGVWFGTPGMPPVASLELPDLTDVKGWTYEGWAVVNGIPYSTGTFGNPKAKDDNASDSKFKGDDGDGPDFPGEDFVQNLEMTSFPASGADLRGATMVISIEPVPDDSEAPFLLKPLTGVAGMDTAPTDYDMTGNLASFPSGTISK